ncbi:MAG: hypothetical protein WBG42_15480 [Cryomorphaceae bacterium]
MRYPTELTGQEIGGIYIHEPGALVSNIAIALTCFIIAIVNRNVERRSSRLWILFVICIGVAASGGMVSHGFPTYLSPEQYFAVWWLKNDFVLLGNLFAGLAVFTLTDVSPRKLTLVFIAKFIVAATLLFILFDFLPAVVDLALTYIAILIITWKKTGIQSAKLLKQSFLIALFSGVFYLFPFSTLDGWFTNKDAVHVFAIISLIYVSNAIQAVER